MSSASIPVLRKFTTANGISKPVLLSRGTRPGGSRFGDQRMAPARPCRLIMQRDRDGANGALNGTVQLWGANLKNPDMENATAPTSAVLRGDGVAVNYETDIAHLALGNNTTIVLVFRNDLVAKTGTATVVAGQPLVTGAGTSFLAEAKEGDTIKINGESFSVVSVTSDTLLVVDGNFVAAAAGATITGSADPVITPTTNYTIANNGGKTRVTFGAAATAPAGSRVEVHRVVPIQVMADGAHPMENVGIKAMTVLWLQATGATISSTDVTLEPIGE